MVVLVVLLRLVERSGRHDLRSNRVLETRLQGVLCSLRQAALLVVVIEDRGPVLIAVIAELRVLRQWIDIVPENVEQLLLADLGRVVSDLDRLGKTRAAP